MAEARDADRRAASAPSSSRSEPNAYRNRTRGAQEAHEAIRPSSFAAHARIGPVDTQARRVPPVRADLEARARAARWRRPASTRSASTSAPAATRCTPARAKRVFDGYQARLRRGQGRRGGRAASDACPTCARATALDLVDLTASSTSPSRRRATPRRRWSRRSRSRASAGRRPTRRPSRRSGSAAT